MPLTSSDRRSSQTLVARRASDTAQTADARSTDRTTSGTQGPGVEEQQDSGDRTTASAADGTAPEPGPRHRDHASVEATRRLAKYDPDDIELRRLLVVSLNVFGEVKLQAKEFDGRGTVLQRRARDRCARCCATIPDVRCGRTTSPSRSPASARVHVRRDAHANARPYFFEEAVAVERELAEGRPPDRLLYNLQIHLGELGDLYVRLGDRSEALKVFEERLQIRRRRLAAMPGDSQRLTDVSVALDRVGQLIREQGDPNGSRTYFEEALKIDRALLPALVHQAGLAGEPGFQPDAGSATSTASSAASARR